jgi:hypothetical protein
MSQSPPRRSTRGWSVDDALSDPGEYGQILWRLGAVALPGEPPMDTLVRLIRNQFDRETDVLLGRVETSSMTETEINACRDELKKAGIVRSHPITIIEGIQALAEWKDMAVENVSLLMGNGDNETDPVESSEGKFTVTFDLPIGSQTFEYSNDLPIPDGVEIIQRSNEVAIRLTHPTAATRVFGDECLESIADNLAVEADGPITAICEALLPGCEVTIRRPAE